MPARPFLRWLVGAALGIALAAAAAEDAAKPASPADTPLPAPAPAPAPAVAPAVPATADASAPRKAEGLNVGDKVHFFVEEDPVKGTGPMELLVSPLGDLSFPVSRNSDLLVVVASRGRTVSDIKQELKGKLDADYYQNATIYLRLHDQSQRRIQVLFSGEVRNNVLPFASGETVTLFEAIVKAGYTDFSNLKKVKLHRMNPLTQKTEHLTFDVDAMLKGDRSKDVPLQDGDHVEVPQKRIVGF